MANITTSGGHIDGAAGNYTSIRMVASWDPIGLGDEIVSVTVTTQFISTELMWDGTNSASMTVGSHAAVTDTNIAIGSSGSYWKGTKSILSHTYSIGISQTNTTTVSIQAHFDGVQVAGGDLGVSGGIVLPASGVPFEHPKWSETGTHHFATPTTAIQAYFTGGTSWYVNTCTVKIMTDRAGTTAGLTYTGMATACTPDPATGIMTISLTSYLSNILSYWSITVHEITRIAIEITTKNSAGDNISGTSTIYITPKSIQECYSIEANSLTVSRGTLTGGYTAPQTISMRIRGATDCPFVQAGVWPDSPVGETNVIRVLFKKASTNANGSYSIGAGSEVVTYTCTDSITVGSTDGTQVYNGYLYQVSSGHTLTQLGTQAYTLPSADSFIALRYFSGDNRVGINNGNPLKTLDVIGTINSTGSISTDGGLTVAGETHLNGQIIADSITHIRKTQYETVPISATGYSLIPFSDSLSIYTQNYDALSEFVISDAQVSISYVTRTTTVCTVETTTAHGLTTGSLVHITECPDNNILGHHLVTGSSNTTTFTFALAGTALSRTARTGYIAKCTGEFRPKKNGYYQINAMVHGSAVTFAHGDTFITNVFLNSNTFDVNYLAAQGYRWMNETTSDLTYGVSQASTTLYLLGSDDNVTGDYVNIGVNTGGPAMTTYPSKFYTTYLSIDRLI